MKLHGCPRRCSSTGRRPDRKRRDLEAELAWLGELLQRRLSAYFAEPSTSPPLAALGPPPALDRDGSPYAHFVLHRTLTAAERTVFCAGPTPPESQRSMRCGSGRVDQGFSEFGGVQGATQGAFCRQAKRRPSARRRRHRDPPRRRGLLTPDQKLARLGAVQLSPAAAHEPVLAGADRQPAVPRLVVRGREARPSSISTFPPAASTPISPGAIWSSRSTLDQLDEIRDWPCTAEPAEWGMGSRLRPGFTSLLRPPGTGKTLSACLLGRQCE